MKQFKVVGYRLRDEFFDYLVEAKNLKTISRGLHSPDNVALEVLGGTYIASSQVPEYFREKGWPEGSVSAIWGI